MLLFKNYFLHNSISHQVCYKYKRNNETTSLYPVHSSPRCVKYFVFLSKLL